MNKAGTVAPMYPPGLPMTMAVFHRLSGREAVFYVVPLLASIAILATYMMGARVGGQTVGVAAAALLASSPSFLFQVTAAPMSDVPVTAWWALALALGLLTHPGAAVLSGVATSLAIVTRPNLAPLALIPVAALAWQACRDRAGRRRLITRVAAYLVGVVPGCLVIAALNTLWYGSPTKFGYGSLNEIYQWRNVVPNLARYPVWMVESQTPLVLLAFAAPWVVTRAHAVAWSWIAFCLAVLASYLLYQVFDAWWFLRFMLPAFPPRLVLTAAVVVGVSSRLPLWPRLIAPSALVGLLIWHGLDYARDHAVFMARTEQKYAVAADHVARRLPAKAVVISHQHSGSIRYYARRATMRWDKISRTQLDSTLAKLASAGYRPYILLDSWEVSVFQDRYAGFSSIGRLDWPPMLHMRESNISLYDPADRPAFVAGRSPLTEIVP